MLFEHLIYSTAIAILFGIIYRGLTGREYSWIIILSAFAPDFDIIANGLLKKVGITVLVYGSPIDHGDFHTLSMLVIYAVGVSFLLHPLGIRFMDSLIFAVVGFGAHFVEDALVFSDGYRFIWPLAMRKIGSEILVRHDRYKADFFGIADPEVLKYGMIFLAGAAIFRTVYERKNLVGEMIFS